ncbi:MAG: hypothetical protein HY551_00865 [Elusimicrobia bacterium]|nr:hypothetical protein [Elusimicrobiota bacterium]
MSLFEGRSQEGNFMDTLAELLRRLQSYKGRKIIIVLSTGIDTFSSYTQDDLFKFAKETQAVIYTVNVGAHLAQALEQYLPSPDREIFGVTLPSRGTFEQGRVRLMYLAKRTGGLFFDMRMPGDLGEIMDKIMSSARSQYHLSYIPSNRARDGQCRKIEVKLLDESGGQYKIQDLWDKKEKKKIEYTIRAPECRVAPAS